MVGFYSRTFKTKKANNFIILAHYLDEIVLVLLTYSIKLLKNELQIKEHNLKYALPC